MATNGFIQRLKYTSHSQLRLSASCLMVVLPSLVCLRAGKSFFREARFSVSFDQTDANLHGFFLLRSCLLVFVGCIRLPSQNPCARASTHPFCLCPASSPMSRARSSVVTASHGQFTFASLVPTAAPGTQIPYHFEAVTAQVSWRKKED